MLLPNIHIAIDDLPRHEIWDYQDWLATPDHPCQRPTDEHAEMAKKKHLKEDFLTHRHVHAVDFNGTIYKANGHTRTGPSGKAGT